LTVDKDTIYYFKTTLISTPTPEYHTAARVIGLLQKGEAKHKTMTNTKTTGTGTGTGTSSRTAGIATATATSSCIPRRDFGRKIENDNLSPSLPIVGLGCSSFSTFFWTSQELEDIRTSSGTGWTPETIDKSHPRIQEWINTIHIAIIEYGFTLLDTAPWYGHGVSEVVIGWAMDSLPSPTRREDLTINTKVGRYDAEPIKQFDFSREATLASVQRSLQRINCDYIDVVQLHDPEFAPSLEELMTETIPALLECRSRGWCKALGMTGYPLEVQYQILQRTLQDFGDTRVWDQALTYSHFNLHDSSLFDGPIHIQIDMDRHLKNGSNEPKSFAECCDKTLRVGLLAAAPLSMGLLTNTTNLPEWHPASNELVQCCRRATLICEDLDVEISELALLHALTNPKIPCTILGCKNVKEVQYAAKVANRLREIDNSMSHYDIMKKVCTRDEYQAYSKLTDKKNGPFASVWANGNFSWDGVQIAREFWKQIDPKKIPDWQIRV
jgi:L-galactose dehydrogenase